MELLSYDVRDVLARILIVILALLILILLSRVLTRIVTIPLRRLLKRANYPNIDETIRMLLRGPSRYLVAALALLVAALVLNFGPALTLLLNRLGISLLILAVVLFFLRLISYFFFTSAQLQSITGLNIDDVLLPFIKNALKISAMAIGFVFALQAWGIDVGALIAGLGIAGLAVSLAAQDTISNMFGFVVIITDRPFVVGEWIWTPDSEGSVEEVRLRSTRVRQMDQSLVIVPNSKMASASVVNWSRLGKRMLNVTFGIAGSTTPEVMQGLLDRLRAVLLKYPSIEQSTTQVYFLNIGVQSLEVLVRAYIMIPDVLAFRAEQEKVLLELKREVDTMNLHISSPSQTLYIQNMENLLPGASRPEDKPPGPPPEGDGDQS
ncbi:MAG TPA: mechanosensitive ion channel family protein [Candidatus Limnocylindrales bacterium]|nr:mechanosensitive ion channel family protein [Candidatus Limnocylindrales bacterium]